MSSVNKVILVGRLGTDPDVRSSGSGDSIAAFSLATSEQRKDSNGMRVEATEWHRVVCFKKLAEIASQFLRKGSLVYIEGSIRTRKWTDRDGNERYSTEIIANQMQMLGHKQDNADGGRPARHAPRPVRNAELEDDDVPF